METERQRKRDREKEIKSARQGDRHTDKDNKLHAEIETEN